MAGIGVFALYRMQQEPSNKLEQNTNATFIRRKFTGSDPTSLRETTETQIVQMIG